MNPWRHKLLGTVLAALGTAGVLVAAPLSAAPESTGASVNLNIAAQPLGDALTEFAKQSGLQIMLFAEVSAGLSAPSVVGTYSPQAALKLLLASTDLSYEYVNDRTIAIRSRAGERTSQSSATGDTGESSGGAARLAQAGEPSVSQGEGRGEEKNQTGEELKEYSTNANAIAQDPIEVVVTGTHIRGSIPLSSSLVTYSRKDIDRSGAGNVEQFIRTIPQNLASVDPNAGTSLQNGNGLQSVNNPFNGTAINLGGLGAGATLTLLDGHRLAPAGAQGDFTDVSLIPLSAVDHVDVLSDGASAVYGADAVAGVANFVLRKDFSGAQTNLRYAAPTQGAGRQYNASQLAGTSWSSGNALIVYDFSQQNELTAADRDFVVPPDPDLASQYQITPEQTRHSLLANFRQSLGDATDAFGTAYFGRRRFVLNDASAFGTSFGSGHAQQQGATLGVSRRLGRSWKSEFGTALSEQKQDMHQGSTSGFDQRSAVDTRITSLELRADGPLVSRSRMALGAELRREKLDVASASSFLSIPDPSLALKVHRDVASFSGELLVPFFMRSESNRPRTELSVSTRYDHYSDFGSATSPRIGLSVDLAPGVKIRSTLARSFQAPTLANLNLSTNSYLVAGLPDASAPGGSTNTLIINGPGNSDLDPQRSRNFTVGLDLTLPGHESFGASLTYFRVHFKDRIAVPPIIAGDLFGIFAQEAALAPFINRAPDAAAIAAVFSDPGNSIQDYTGQGAAGIQATFDNRLQNISTTRQSGANLTLTQDISAVVEGLNTFLSASYLFKIEYRASPTSGTVDFVNTIYNPPHLRMRGGFNWTNESWDASLVLNHTGSYDNTLYTPMNNIHQWTTADAALSYHWGIKRNGGSGGWVASLNIDNLTDEDPPRVRHPEGLPSFLRTFGYDATQATPLGRLVSLSLQKQW